MTKAELIEVLREFPDDIMVVVGGWGGGCTPWVDIEMVKLKLNLNIAMRQLIFMRHRLPIRARALNMNC